MSVEDIPVIFPPPTHHHNNKSINFESALKLLHEIYPDIGGSCIRQQYNVSTVNLDYDLDVIISVYNVENFLAECVESVLRQQTKFYFHITIVSDGSTDNSRQILRQYEKNARVTIIDKRTRGSLGQEILDYTMLEDVM